MTYVKVNTEFFNTNLNPTEILILSVIESLARDSKQCYYTNEQWAKMFNVSVTCIKNTLNELEKKNYIKRNTTTTMNNGKANKRRTIELVHFKTQPFQFSF